MLRHITCSIVAQRSHFLKPSMLVVCPALSSSPQHSVLSTLLAGCPSFGGQRTSWASHQTNSASQEFSALSLSFTEVFSGQFNGICPPLLSPNCCCPPISAVKSKIQLKLTYEALTGRRSNQVSLNVAVNTRLTGRSNGHFAAGRVWAIKSQPKHGPPLNAV